MATKNLARTIIDAGAGSGQLYERDCSKVSKLDSISNWLGTRKIVAIEDRYFWFYYSRGKCQWKKLEVNHIYEAEGFIDGFQPAKISKRAVPAEGRFSQDRPLDEKEIEYFESIPHHIREDILNQAPVRVNERKGEYWEKRAKEKAKAKKYL